eukprot:COSAG02_NODE_876_length_16272_cov_138.802510_13_plen_479_part_00
MGAATMADEVAAEHVMERTVRTLQFGQFFRSCQWAVTNTANTQLAMVICRGDYNRVVRIQSTGTTISSLIELAASPFFGMVTDRLGRKPVLLVCGLVKTPIYLAMVASPSIYALLLSPMFGECAYQMYKLAESTVMADLVADPKLLAICTTRIGSMMGASQVCGNLFGGALAVVNPRIPFLLGAAAGISQVAIISLGLKETGPSARATDHLPQTMRDPKGVAATKKLAVNRASVVQFVDLPLRPDREVTSANRAEQGKPASSGRTWHIVAALFSTRTLSLLTSAALIDGLVDLTWNIRPIFAQQRLGMGAAQYGAWEATRGLVRLCSGALTSWLLQLLGIRGFNLLAHVASIVQQSCWIMSTKPFHLYLALIPMSIGEQGVRDSVLKSCHTRVGVQVDLGLGDVQAALRTMQSLLSVPMPMVMSWLYARDSSLPWAFCAVLSAASATLFAMLSKGDIVRVSRNHGRDQEDAENSTSAT